MLARTAIEPNHHLLVAPSKLRRDRQSRQLVGQLVPGHVDAKRSDAGWAPTEINCTAGWWIAGRSWRWRRAPVMIRRLTDESRGPDPRR